MSTPRSTSEPPWRAGLRAARATALPGLVLQSIALALVVAYYQHEPTHRAVESLATWRANIGITFSVISTGVFGGVIPFLYLKSRRRTRDQFTWAGGAALIGFWAYKGIEVDLWYRLLARFIGEGTDVRTIAIKTFLDQFVYCPVFAVPVTVIVYEWTKRGFHTQPVVSNIRRNGWYHREVLPVLISNLGVWVPAVCIIYSLPTALQLPLQNIVLCFFTLLLAHVMQNPRPSSSQ